MPTPPEFLRSILSGASEASAVVLPTGTIWFMNEPARRLFHVVNGRSGIHISTYLSFFSTTSSNNSNSNGSSNSNNYAPDRETLQLSWEDVTEPEPFDADGKRNVEGVGMSACGERIPVAVNLVRVTASSAADDFPEETRSGESSASETRRRERDEDDVIYYCLYIKEDTPARLQVASLQDEVSRVSATSDAIVRASGMLLMVIDDGGCVRSVTDGLPQMFGYDQDSAMIGQHVNVFLQERGGNLSLDDDTRRDVTGIHCDGSSIGLRAGLSRTSSYTGNNNINSKNTVIMMKSKEPQLLRELNEKISQGLEERGHILDAAFDPMFCTNKTGIVTMLNEAAVKEFGWRKDELIGKNISVVVGSTHRHHHDSYVQRYNQTKKKRMIGLQREIRCSRKNRTEFTAVLGLAEIPTGFCGFLRKNTQQKIHEDTLQKAERKIAKELEGQKGITRAILDASFDALFVINDRGMIQEVSETSSTVFGWERDEFLGRNITMIMTSEEASGHDQYLRNYLKTGIKMMIGTEREVTAQRKDKSIFPCVLGLSQAKNSDLFVGFIRDLTSVKAVKAAKEEISKGHRNIKAVKEVMKAAKEDVKAAKEDVKAAKEDAKAAKEDVKAAKEDTKAAKEDVKAAKEDIQDQKNITLGILDASFDALFVINNQGIIQQVNETSLSVFGWKREEFIGQNISMIMTSHVAVNHDQFLQNYIETGMKQMIGTQREVTAQRKDKSTFPCILGLSQAKDTGLFCGFIRDLTAEKAAQSKISEEKNINLGILDASFDALFVINNRGIIQQVNETSSKVFGWTREEFIGQNISMIMTRNVATNHDQYLQNYLETGMKKMIDTQREVTAQRKDKSTFPCVLGLSQARDTGLFCGFIRDLTADKAAQAKLVESNNINLGILDASFDALFVINNQGIIQQVNETSSKVFGWKREDFLGQNISMIMTRNVATNHNQYLHNYLETGMKKMIGTQREVTAQRKDKSTFPCVLGLSQARDTGLFCGFIRDLTADKAAQSKLVESHKFMTKILDSSFDTLFVINEQGIILQTNSASTKVFGWTEEEFIGKNISMIMPEGHAKKHDSYLDHYIRTGFKKIMGKQREVEAKRKDGSSFPCILGLSETITNGSRQFIGFIKDVTVEKSLLRAEAEREASDSLLHNILPEHIAHRLKQDPSHIADHYTNTTIMFADIVGFTKRATIMSPHDVVTMLNDLFSRFDYLVDHYELNKVKTIGDCYMATSIPSSDLEQDGCARVCRFALDLMKAVRAFNDTGPQHGHIEMRIGIATGDVVAGVVGTKRFLFDMWGDAVNVAARMEQHGLPGQIQVTKDVVDNAGPDFTFECRGKLAVKSKGTMNTYLLKSAKNVTLRRSVYQHWKPTSISAARSNSTSI